MDGQMRLAVWVLAAASALRGTGAACGPEYLPPFENGKTCGFAVEGHDLGRENAYRLYDSTARNLLPNPSFELGFRGWRNISGGGGEWKVDEKPRYEIAEDGALFGRRMLVVNASNGAVAPLCFVGMPWIAGKAYTLSWYAKADRPGPKFSLNFMSVKRGGKYARGSKAFGEQPFELTTEWKRYSRTIVSDGLPIAFYMIAWQEPGVRIFVDGIQFEQGERPTEYCEAPLSARLDTADPDFVNEKGRPLAAKLTFWGTKAGRATVTLTDFFHADLWHRTVDVKDGTVLELGDFDGAARPRGAYFVTVDYAVDGVRAYADRFRFAVIRSLPKAFPTKDVYGLLWDGRDFRFGEKSRLSERLGFGGSASYCTGFDLLGRKTYLACVQDFILTPEEQKLRAKSDHWLWYMRTTWAWRRDSEKEITKPYRHFPQEVLDWIEKRSEEVLREHPEFEYWSYGTEEENGSPVLKEGDFEEYAKLLRAFYRGARKGNPKAVLMPSGGTSGYGRVRGREYLIGMLKATPEIRWGACAAHPYGACDGTLGDDDLDAVLDLMSDDMKGCGYDERTPIILNEGWGAGAELWGEGPDYSYGGGNNSLDMGLHEFIWACKLCRVYLTTLKRWPRIPHYNTWQVNRLTIDHSHVPYSGMVGINAMANLLSEPTFVADIRPSAGMRGFAFRDTKSGGVAAVWCTLDDVDAGRLRGPIMNVRFSGYVPRLADMTGRTYPLQPLKDGSYDLRLTPAPLYLVAPDAEKLAADLNNGQVIGAGMSLKVNILPKKDGGLETLLENMTARPVEGALKIDDRRYPFSLAGKGTARQDLMPGKIEFGRLFTWSCTYDAEMPKAEPSPKKWNLGYWYSPYVDKLPADWSRIPAVRMDRRKGFWDREFKAVCRTAWNEREFYVRVEAEKPAFDVGNAAFWSDPNAQKRQLYELDGCLEVYFDTAANGRLRPGDFDLDDYRYDFACGNAKGESGPGLVCRFREPYMEIAGGVLMPSKEEAAKGVKCAFERLGPGKFAYTLVFARKFVEPMKLVDGGRCGFAVQLHSHDLKDKKRWGMLTTSSLDWKTCDHNPQFWPILVLKKEDK